MNLFFLCIAGFIAAFVDAIAGGGGIISIPAFLLFGVPIQLTLGTNKLCATCGSLTSSIKFTTSKKVDFKLLKFLIPFTLLGATLGVNIVLKIDEKILNIIILVLILSIGIYSMFSKSLGEKNNYTGLNTKNIILGILFAFIMGFYDGFFGPGTGSLLMFGFIKILGFDFIKATGNSKILNFVSNITSLILFALNKKIIYILGIPVALFMILGAQLGSRTALTKGCKIIKPVFITMSLAVVGKIIIEMF